MSSLQLVLTQTPNPCLTGKVRDDGHQRGSSRGVHGEHRGRRLSTPAHCHPGHSIRLQDESRCRDLGDLAFVVW